jgi:hypothetical protein
MQTGSKTPQRPPAEPQNYHLQMLRVGLQVLEFIRMLIGGSGGKSMKAVAPTWLRFIAILEFGETLRNSVMQLDGSIQFNRFEPAEREFRSNSPGPHQLTGIANKQEWQQRP